MSTRIRREAPGCYLPSRTQRERAGDDDDVHRLDGHDHCRLRRARDPSVDARPGGRIQFRWKDWGLKNYTGSNDGPVLEAVRPTRFVFQWRVDSAPYRTTVEIDLEPVADGTIVRLIEYGYEDSAVGRKDFLTRVSGWAHVLTLMKFYLEHGAKY